MTPEDEVQLQSCMEQALRAASAEHTEEEISNDLIPQPPRWEVLSPTETASFTSQFSSAIDTLRPHLTKAVEQIRKETGLKRVTISIGFRIEPVLQVTIED